MAAAWRREKKIKAKKRAPPGQGVALQPALHASEGMMQALNGTGPRHHADTVSRKQLNKLLAQACSHMTCAAPTHVPVPLLPLLELSSVSSFCVRSCKSAPT